MAITLSRVCSQEREETSVKILCFMVKAHAPPEHVFFLKYLWFQFLCFLCHFWEGVTLDSFPSIHSLAISERCIKARH